MDTGGGAEYNYEATRAVRVVGVIVTPVLALYATLILAGYISSTHYISAQITLLISISWVIVSVLYYFRPIRSRADQAIRLAFIHAFALLMFMFVTGFEQPFAPLFVLLFLANHIYFGQVGLILSVSSIAFAAGFDMILRYPLQPTIVAEDSMTVFAIIFLGLAVIGVVSAQETKRQALIHSQRRERLQYDRILTIINNMTDAAFTTDQKGAILMYNAACLDILDTNDSLKNKNIGELFKLTDKDKAPSNLMDLLKESTRATRRDDLNHTYNDGEAIRLEITFAPIRSNYSLTKKRDDLGGYILIMRDVTKQKSLEEERDEFISVVSHELRTPITIVEGSLSNLDIMMKQPKPVDPKVLNGTVTTAHDQVLYLAKMVNDLSTLSRAERGVADAPEEIDVEELLHAMHRQYEKEAAARKLHLNLDLGHKLGKVNVSRLYLEELLQNFITNSIKYTKTGSITIIAKRSNNTVTFSVKDTGIGMSRSDQNKIFNKFYRSEDYRIRETSGTGLGLYVSTKLAHKLKTHIDLTSRLNHGSTFSFELQVE
ncbi:MAG: ATP-binding protein [Candidatus Saccharimonadaceae bacterium]